MTAFTELFQLEPAPGRILRVGYGDLTRQSVDAIVNAANEHLQHGGGVAGAIVHRGGRIIQDESHRVGPVPTGGVAVTTAGRLPARWVIHAVGPRGGMPGAPELLRRAVWSALTKAAALGAATVAMPPISTGIFGFPKADGCRIIATTARDFLRGEAGSVVEVRLMDLTEAGAMLLARPLAEGPDSAPSREPEAEL